jgi:predicted 3-demethylubiquinone-9 3-methyltransferase (glyoxalase superfamily)
VPPKFCVAAHVISFVVRCDSQHEEDDYWSKLPAGGSEMTCGWPRDKFGLGWQIVPAKLANLVKHPKAMQAMRGMKMIDLAKLERAANSGWMAARCTPFRAKYNRLM